MKPQDFIFILILIILFWRRNPRYFIVAGLVCFVLSIPLFYFWIFFTAQRFVIYAAIFLFVAIIYLLSKDTFSK